MAPLRDVSIQRKLILVILSTSLLALSLACLGFTLYERASVRAAMTNELSALADVLGANTAASLTFNDQKSARDMLNALQAERHVVAACLYDPRGNLFAEYIRPAVPRGFRLPPLQKDGAQFDEESLTLYRSVSISNEKVGSIAIVSDLSDLHAKLRQYAEIAVLVFLISVLATFVISSRLLRLITQPILQLAGVAGKVSADENYGLRAIPRGSDEVGVLITSFNHMLDRIQERDAALQNAKNDLEVRVQERTEELQKEVVERKQAEIEMRKARDAAEEASRSKSEFLANMSHEIRTPLNGVMGMTDLALDTELTTEQQEYLETVKFSADSLLTVINDILDFSKIEAGKVDMEFVDFNVRDCMEGTLKTLAVRSDEKGLELLCEIGPEVPEVVKGDSGRLRQILINLVGNAIKFTDAGEVVLRVETQQKDGEDRVLHFVVADTGIGIPLEKQQVIFDSFTQADTSTTRKYGGTGLGLTISARLVELMGGKIWVESEVGRGTRFHFTARLDAGAPALIDAAAASPREILRDVRVMVVDDNRTNRRILEEMLKRWHMLPVAVEDGDEALAQLLIAEHKGEPFKLILTDMHMPKTDGFGLVEHIRERPELSAAIIMMLTSAGHRGDSERCRELGVVAYLLKPIRQSELREALARVLGAHDESHPAQLITRYSLQDSGDAAAPLRILLAEDNVVNQRLAMKLLEKRGHLVVLASNGREALDALSAGSYDLVFMDVQMPEMDGIEATMAIRAKEKGSPVHQPVIALTAHAMKGDSERCLAAGMDAYLTKPIQAHELDEMLLKYRGARGGNGRHTKS